MTITITFAFKFAHCLRIKSKFAVISQFLLCTGVLLLVMFASEQLKGMDMRLSYNIGDK